MGYMPEQVQDFYPTPSTLSTVMYYTGLDPRTMERVYVPVSPHEKAMQRALIQYRDPKNYKLVYEALLLAKREDLIGSGPKCLIHAPRGKMPQIDHNGSGEKQTRSGTAKPTPTKSAQSGKKQPPAHRKTAPTRNGQPNRKKR